MKCIYCNHAETKVVDSRESDDQTRRRRECLKCSKRYTSYETAEPPQVYIIKKDHTRQLYQREKLKHSIVIPCQKLPISMEKIGDAVSKIENKLRLLDTNEIKSKYLGEQVMKQLKQINKVAYIRFAAVYREFAALDDFKQEIQNLVKKG